MRLDEQDLTARLRAFVEPGETEFDDLSAILPEDIAEAMARLDGEERLAVLKRLPSDVAAYVLVELPTETARGLVDQLPDTTVAHYLDILPMDDAAELREELDPERFEALLQVIPQEDADEIRRLLSYPDDSAGQIMTEDFVEVGAAATMADVLATIRSGDVEEFETVNTIYVLSEDRHLLGVLSLRRVIRSEPDILARDLMNPEPITCRVDQPQEEVARLLARYSLTAMPVLDDRGRMVGIVTADDAQEILQEADTQDVLKMGAVSGDAEAYLSLPITQLVKRRLPWLLVLFLAEFFTGSVLRHYNVSSEEGLKTNLSQLMLFVPLLIGAGGNAGSQVTTTITRALALGEVRAKDWALVMRRELAVAFLIGATLGLLGFVRSHMPVVGWGQPMSLSLVVGLALPAIVVWAAAVGSLLPIGAKGAGQDPAVMSAPFISTFVDATGLIIYFEVARAVLRLFGQTF